jgi:hypothetical protein
MAPAKDDPFSFVIQLTTEDAGRNYHRKNDGDQIQRPDVVDDICQGLLLQARIDRVVHGHIRAGGDLATLVVFGFRFHGIDDNRRFKQATITISFQDEQKQNKADPEVIALWPNGDFTLGQSTEIDVEETSGGEAGANVTGGAVVQGGGHTTMKWERRQNYKKMDRSTLTGSIILDTKIRDFGANNAIRLTLNENKAAGSGLVTDFRAAVLLKRINDTDIFLGAVTMKAKANFLYDAIRGLRDVTGFSPPNDPVRFKPGFQYLRPPTLARFMENKLAEEVERDNLNATKLDELAGVLGTTVLTATV